MATIYDVQVGSAQAEKIGSAADLVTYDSTTSGASSSNVKGALDESFASIASEESRATLAETTLSGAISAEVFRATEAEGTLSGAISTINGKIGTASGIAELDANGKVPASQLPGFVDDVVEGFFNSQDGKFYEEDTYETEIPGEEGKIYVDLPTNTTYRWSGSAFVAIGSSLALGETSSTAYRGDRGKAAYDHSQVQSGNPHGVTKAEVGLGNVPNVTTDNQTPTFTEASTRANIASGETLSVIFGKIKKFFADIKAVALSGSYTDLSDTPTIPTKTSDLTNDSGYITAADVPATGGITFNGRNGIVTPQAGDYTASDVGLGNVPNVTTNNQTPTFSEAATRANIASGETLDTLFGKIKKFFTDLKTVAFTGSYNDLTDQPTIPSAITVDSAMSSSSTNPVQNAVITTALSAKMSAPTVLSKSLAANATSLSFTNAAIGASTLLNYYSSVDGVCPTASAVSGTTLTLTFPSSHAAATIKVRCEN